MHFHQLILGNVSYAVLLLVICFLNDLKIAQYETFPSSLFWRRTEGELTLFCFTGARSHEVFRCSGAGASCWGWERQHNEGTWSEPELKKVPAVVRAASRPGTCGSCVSAGHSRTGHPAADLPLLLLQLACGAPQTATIWPGDADHVRTPLCELLQHTLTLETKCKLGTTSPRHPPQSYNAIPFLVPTGAPHHWLLGLCLVFIGTSFLSCSVSC